jgi:rhombotail lipoprotein
MTNKALFIACLGALMLAGCSSLWDWGGGRRSGPSSSLVDYLYPGGEIPPQVEETIPYLQLPLRVGIAFVPGSAYGDTISESTRMQLLERVKAEFVDRDYISHIEVIPETYLRSSKGITGMQQVARLYSLDVMALVSYDQVAVSEENPSGLLYWTIVGAYVIKATSNEVQTFVDTAVFDVSTAKLLFRAPGAHAMSDRSTLVESQEVVRKSKDASFAAAMEQMTGNLAGELDRFQERVKEDSQVARVEWQPGHGGGGAFGLLFLAALATMLGRRLRRVDARGIDRPTLRHVDSSV